MLSTNRKFRVLHALRPGGGVVSNFVKGGLRTAPGSTALNALGLLLMGASAMRKPVGDFTDDLGMNPWREEERGATRGMERSLVLEDMREQGRREELDRLTRVNTMRMMQMEPALAQTLMAGRRLPEGATVIGGQPRMDLLEQVSRQMAEGRFSTPPGGGGLMGD